MTVILTVTKGDDVVRVSVLELGDALAAATIEVLNGYSIAIGESKLEVPKDNYVEMRQKRTIN